jgi:hypothetical protein
MQIDFETRSRLWRKLKKWLTSARIALKNGSKHRLTSLFFTFLEACASGIEWHEIFSSRAIVIACEDENYFSYSAVRAKKISPKKLIIQKIDHQLRQSIFVKMNKIEARKNF